MSVEVSNEKFNRVRDRVVGVKRQSYGIGTLSEKTMHNVLKNYYEENEDYQEIPINEFVADIYRDGQIVEIQTGNFNKLRRKLDSFLEEYKVTIVYPISYIKYLIWIDEETGRMSDRRRSPKKENYYTAFNELYKIKMYLKHPNLSLKLVLLEVEELKFEKAVKGKNKRRTKKYDKIPLNIIEELDIERPEDFVQLIPIELGERFTAGDFAKSAKIHISYARVVLNIFHYLDIVERVDKSGNSYIYEVK